MHVKTSSKHKEFTKIRQELHSLYIKSLKKKISGYGIDQSTLGYPINLSRGEKVDKNVYNDMCQVEILVKKNGVGFSKFFQEKSPKVILFQLFQRIAKHLDISLSLEEAFPFPITAVPISIALYLYQLHCTYINCTVPISVALYLYQLHCTYMNRNSWWKFEVVRVRKGTFLKWRH